MHKIFTNTIFLGKSVIYLPSCHSTNDIAASIISKKAVSEGAIIITDNQTAGKGQRGNTWEAEEGKNLTVSIILKPHFLDISEQFFLNIIISLAIHDLFSQYINHGLSIKWPNDIFFYDNKLGGILIENTIKNNQLEHVVVGIGLNINQLIFKNKAAISLANICGQQFDLQELMSLLLETVEKRYFQLKKDAKQNIHKDYLQVMYWINEKRTFMAGDSFEGEIKGIDAVGRLMIQENQNIRYFNNKEVSFVR
ncbi:MAG: biotin--[acetyl-CoA-carboxylase] ligase [Bacteroidota bacterium]|nr:biotin--[acetyl-CoA-carboxylase] ligase [Bacteroidota bacterium]